MKVLVCGGRDFGDSESLFHYMDGLHKESPISLLIEGGAHGADRHGKNWAIYNGIPGREFRANWGKFGDAAGPIRNQRMIDEGMPDLVVAFPGGNGTADMVRRARTAGVRTIKVKL